jgi:hypothetical protein
MNNRKSQKTMPLTDVISIFPVRRRNVVYVVFLKDAMDTAFCVKPREGKLLLYILKFYYALISYVDI